MKQPTTINNYWKQIRHEWENRKNSNCFFAFTEFHKDCKEEIAEDLPKRRPSKKNRVHLGPEFNDKYLTEREAECVELILEGKTYQKAAEELDLSKRSVEFYINNTKQKLGFRTKKELILKLKNSSFNNMLALSKADEKYLN